MSRSLAGQEKSESSIEQGPSCQKAAASPRNRVVGSRIHTSPGRGADEVQAGLIVGLAIQVVPGASLQVHVSLASSHNPPPVELPADSP